MAVANERPRTFVAMCDLRLWRLLKVLYPTLYMQPLAENYLSWLFSYVEQFIICVNWTGNFPSALRLGRQKQVCIDRCFFPEQLNGSTKKPFAKSANAAECFCKKSGIQG